VVIRAKHRKVVKYLEDGSPVERDVSTPIVSHVDIIGDQFWREHPDLLLCT
jgi:hypothetical protein